MKLDSPFRVSIVPAATPGEFLVVAQVGLAGGRHVTDALDAARDTLSGLAAAAARGEIVAFRDGDKPTAYLVQGEVNAARLRAIGLVELPLDGLFPAAVVRVTP